MLVSLIPDVIYQNLLKLPVDDRDVLLVVLFVIAMLRDIVGGDVEKVVEVSTVVVVSIEVVGMVDV